MKSKRILTVTAFAAIALVTAAFVNKPSCTPETPVKANGKGIAVLELFTSEGCSSCPPADALLGRIQQAAGDKEVYCLAFHVDYWNRLGWKDIFSNSRNSERQYWYSSLLNGQVYTPQLIINGKASVIGSDSVAVNRAVQEALGQGTALAVTLQGQPVGQHMQVNYAVTGNASGNRLVVALVQKKAISQVKRGENEGRTLTHVQTVQLFRDFAVARTNKGTVELPLPAAFNRQEWEVIGWLQQPGSGAIQAAARASFTDTIAVH